MGDSIESQIVLLSNGYFDEPVTGSVEIKFPFPTFLSKVTITVVSCFTGIKLPAGPRPQSLPIPPLTIDSNINEWNKLTSYLTPVLTYNCTDDGLLKTNDSNTQTLNVHLE